MLPIKSSTWSIAVDISVDLLFRFSGFRYGHDNPGFAQGGFSNQAVMAMVLEQEKSKAG